MTDDRSLRSLEILKAARALIDKGWTKREYARDASGHTVGWTNQNAVCFCSDGAVLRAALDLGGSTGNETWELLCRAAEHFGFLDEVSLNDDPETEKPDVLAMFDKAIALAAQPQGSGAAGPSSSSPSGL